MNTKTLAPELLRKQTERPWLAGSLPEVVGGGNSTPPALIREYFFVSLFRA